MSLPGSDYIVKKTPTGSQENFFCKVLIPVRKPPAPLVRIHCRNLPPPLSRLPLIFSEFDTCRIKILQQFLGVNVPVGKNQTHGLKSALHHRLNSENSRRHRSQEAIFIRLN